MRISTVESLAANDDFISSACDHIADYMHPITSRNPDFDIKTGCTEEELIKNILIEVQVYTKSRTLLGRVAVLFKVLYSSLKGM